MVSECDNFILNLYFMQSRNQILQHQYSFHVDSISFHCSFYYLLHLSCECNKCDFVMYFHYCIYLIMHQVWVLSGYALLDSVL